jgi:hypothetical protein
MVASLKCSTLWLRDCKLLCMLLSSALLYRQQHWLTYLASCGLQELLFLFLSAVAPNSKSNGQLEHRHHRTQQEAQRDNTLYNPMVNWNPDGTVQEAKREWSSEHICLQSPQAHTHKLEWFLFVKLNLCHILGGRYGGRAKGRHTIATNNVQHKIVPYYFHA